MGCSHAIPLDRDSDVTNKIISNEISSYTQKTRDTSYKLLLLGTGSSGKSTLFKSIRIINEGKLDHNELQNALPVMRRNCVAGILNMLKNSQKMFEKDPGQNAECVVELNDQIIGAIQIIVNFGSETFKHPLDEEELAQLSTSISLLWSLRAIQATFSRRGNQYSFPDNMDYFYDKIDDIMTMNYIPTQQDMLRVRVRTTGITEFSYEMKENMFTVSDVGGQRNERKKWMHSFEDVAAVLFVTALNHFNALLLEDETKNAMHESLEVFDETINEKWFRNTEFILFLNKEDLFEQELRNGNSLKDCFSVSSGWDGDQWNYENCDLNDEQQFHEYYEASLLFIQDQYVQKNTSCYRVVFSHVTNATDTDTVHKVFWDVQNIVIRKNLRRGGLMV
eukprot:191950_1